MFWLLAGRLLSPFGLVDVMISLAELFLVIGIEFLIIFYLYCSSAEIVVIENNIAIIIGIMHFLYSLFLTLSINTDYLVQSLCD